MASVVCAQDEVTPQWRSGTLCRVVLDVLDPIQRLDLVPMELADQRGQVLCLPMCVGGIAGRFFSQFYEPIVLSLLSACAILSL